MTALVVRDPGPATTVQDLGRPAARRWGVPVSGMLAPDWLRLANALVGNPAGAAGLEMRLAGPRLAAEGGAVTVAVGGPMTPVLEGAAGRRRIAPWQAIRMEPGETLTLGRVEAGTTAVLAVAGGIDTPPVLGSRATYARAGLGGFEGRALAPGDRLPLGPAPDAPPLALPRPPAEPDGAIRIVFGPQDDHFTEAARATLLTAPFTATDQADRMGLRLAGPRLAHRDPALAQIVSDGIAPGAVQVPGNGAPIVLLADGQTVGGYPKIATVIAADLPRLARLAPGAQIRFAAVGLAEAEAALAEHLEGLDRLIATARPAGADIGLDPTRLLAANLVSGTVDTARPDHFPWALTGDAP